MKTETKWQYERKKPEPPTDKQGDFAARISERLNIAMPEEYSKKAYSKYIEEWKDWL